jgi:hypothetical protein
MPFGMIHEGPQVFRRDAGAGGFEMGCGHATGELDAQVHDRFLRAVEEIADALHAKHVGDFVGIADRRRHPMAKDAAVEFEWRDQRGFDMEMRVNEARHDDLAGDVDLLHAPVHAMGAHDRVATDCDIGGNDLARDEV